MKRKTTRTMTPARQLSQARNWNKRQISCYVGGILEMIKNRGFALTAKEKRYLIEMRNMGNDLISEWQSTIKE